MKYFITSDVHGYFDELMKALNDAGYDKDNPEHIFVNCGDMFDRGSQAVELLDWVNSIPENRKILICGNHEDLLEECISRGHYKPHDFHNETHYTVKQFYYSENDNSTFVLDRTILEWLDSWEPYRKYISSLVNYAVVGNNIFVHGWIPIWIKSFEDLRNAEDADWYEARWYNGMEMWDFGHKIPNYTIFCGHWHTSWGHHHLHNHGKEFLEEIETYYIDESGIQQPFECFESFIDEGIVALDACCAYSGKLNVFVLNI